jgi:hypothetical protein
MANHTFAYAIKNQWLNMSVYFINFMYNTSKPFEDTLVGGLLKSPIFKGVVQILRYGPLVLNPGGLILASTEFIAAQYSTDYLASWSNVLGKYVCPFIMTPNRLKDNNDLLGGKQRNSKWFANGEYIKTRFIKLDKTDIISFYGNPDNGFAYDKSVLTNANNYQRKSNNTSGNPNSGKFNITNQERQNNDSASPIWNNDNLYYFLKSTNNNDVIKFLIGSGII